MIPHQRVSRSETAATTRRNRRAMRMTSRPAISATCVRAAGAAASARSAHSAVATAITARACRVARIRMKFEFTMVTEPSRAVKHAANYTSDESPRFRHTSANWAMW